MFKACYFIIISDLKLVIDKLSGVEKQTKKIITRSILTVKNKYIVLKFAA